MLWSPKPKVKNRSCCWTTSSTNSTPGGSNSSSGWSGTTVSDRSSSPTATRRVCAPFWTKQATTTRSSRSKTEESCDETKQDGHRRRTARRIFQRPYVAAKVAEGRLRDTWREIVGPAADAETTELRLENHILHVRIRSSILRNELFYQREALGAEINRRSKIRLVNAVIIR